MAKKQITAASSPTEIRAAREQIAKAQQEFKTLYQQKYAGKAFNAAELQRDAAAIASKYDYVDYGIPPSVGNEINIGGDQYFVNGLNNQTNSSNYPPEAKTTVNQDDAFSSVNPKQTTVSPNTNPKANNPNQAKTNQGIANETNPQPVTESPQVVPETASESPTNKIGNKDANEAGAALERNTQNQASQNQNAIVNKNSNELPTTNNLPGRLSDEYSRDPAIVKSTKGNVDDAAKLDSPMGTAIGSFANQSFPDPGSNKPSGTVSIDTAESVSVPNAAPGTNNKPGITERTNILHNYANWTYKLAWYMLDTNTYNSIAKTGKVDPSAGKLIAKSGGVGPNKSNEMAGDVYFRNLRFTSVIGNRQSSAATNNFELEMTIVEPYGASLIGELAAMAVNVTGQGNISPSEVPYLLEIDFAGYKDDGSMVPSILQNGKKYIPVKILAVEMSLTSAGTVYVMSMAPYSFYAMSSRYADMEFGITLKGKTLSEMLGDGPGGLMAQLNLWEELKTNSSKVASVPDKYAIEIYSFNTKGSRDQAMASSPFAYPVVEGDATIMKTRPFSSNSVQESTYTIPKGSIVKDVIKNVVLHSQYYNLRVDPKNPYDPKRVAELIKIIPVIELLPEYDKSRNEYAKKITYKVFNTLNFGEVQPGVGNAPVEDWGYSKIYNWLFTGKNADIIDANLVFNMIYYTKMQTNVTEQNTIKLGQTADGIREWADQSMFKKGIATKGGGVSSSGANVPERYINATVAAEWFDSKLNSSNTDNVTLDLKIIGDPDWIPQDGSLRGGPIEVGTDLVDRYGSISVDVAGVYVKLNLRTPRDYNDKTGLMDLKADQLTIQGVYQVITVESNFEDGKFTQILNMIKVPNQKEEETAGSARQRENNIMGRGGALPQGADPALSRVNNINTNNNQAVNLLGNDFNGPSSRNLR